MNAPVAAVSGRRAAPGRPDGGRVFERRRVWEPTRTTFLFAARLLAHAATARHGPVDAVVGIAAGGTPLAAETSRVLAVERFQVRARHNLSNALYHPATGRVACDFSDLDNARAGDPLNGLVLVVDDICGTGATFSGVFAGLAVRYPDACLVTAALCRNAGALQPPDLWLWDVTDWVVFPWEDRPAGGPTQPLPLPTTVRSR